MFVERGKGHPPVKNNKGLPRTQSISQNNCLKDFGKAFTKCLHCITDLCLNLSLEIIKSSYHASFAVLSCVLSLLASPVPTVPVFFAAPTSGLSHSLGFPACLRLYLQGLATLPRMRHLVNSSRKVSPRPVRPHPPTSLPNATPAAFLLSSFAHVVNSVDSVWSVLQHTGKYLSAGHFDCSGLPSRYCGQYHLNHW